MMMSLNGFNEKQWINHYIS
ncbi:Protein of unknown function [Bacillus wiedmannii]|uniref:Uncharacterized protein n=1 Tax=Bacillus wiedmannii TaxID=1890302 RepID=A0AB37YRG5_9BACI|nr:Protein of unknown function [Bacillus wiedmannii]